MARARWTSLLFVVGVGIVGCGNDEPQKAVSRPDREPESTVDAPPLDPDFPTSFADATSFLYTGDDAIQTGVTPGAIDPTRVVVLRGRVTTRDGAVLPDVVITLPGHPEFGQTRTRSDGRFDMAANGGGLLTLRYVGADFLPVQRQVQTPVLDYVHLPDVVVVSRDSQVTTLSLGASSMQVARGSVQADAAGTRRATVLIPAGTTAELVQPDGSTLPAPELSVRLTEYTVGESGAQAMPGSLPATSAYTYAVELGVDEAVAKVDGRDVVFDQPVYLYLENFLDIPVGEVVPVGYYDPDKSGWVGSENGLVIKLLSGSGDLDVTGDDVADSGSALTDLGVTDAERERLAELYDVGQTLWRTPMQHFSTIDCNWGVICVGTCDPPKEPPPAPASSCQSQRQGSIIGCERQTLGEVVELAGSPFTLHYQSNRVAGRTAEANLIVSLGSAGVSDDVQGTEVELLVAGQKLTQQVSADTPSSALTWNGKDAYGRAVTGSQRFTVRIGYRYKVVYARGTSVSLSWARLSGIPLTGSPARMEVTLFQEWSGMIKRWNNRGQGLGGWSLSGVHAYDPIGRVLHQGDGTERDAEALGASVIHTIAGSQGGSTGDDGPATEALLSHPSGLSLGPDGSLYVADSGSLRVRRISSDGIITNVAGDGTFGNSGDGGPATAAQFNQVTDVAAGPDGSVYLADAGAYRVRRVAPDGVISTFAGNGTIGFSGDGGLATDAGMEPYGLAVAPDGSVYIADRQNSRVRVVDLNGIVTTFAGSSSSGNTGDGGPPTLARLSGPTGVTLGPDGSLFIMDRSNHRVRKVSPQGLISTVAGNGTFGATGDGSLAVLAQLAGPTRVGVGPDGSLYIADAGNHRVRWVGSEGIIATVAGSGVAGFLGDGGLAPAAQLNGPSAVTVAPDGTIYVADFYNNRIRRLSSGLPGGATGDILLPSSDGTEIYVFSGAGRHLRTLDALTGAVRAELTYGPHGLASVDDGDGNLTTVERDAATGAPTAIVAPYGHRTPLRVDEHGFLSGIEDPAGAAVELDSGATGLLEALTDRRGGTYRFEYDSVGRLVRDEDPASGVQTLARAQTPTGSTVTVTTGLGRVTSYELERLASGAQRHVTTDPSGAVTESVRGTDGSITNTAPDGTVDVLVPGPDPRFGMQAPIVASFTRTTPAGLVSVATGTRTTTLAAPDSPLSMETQTDTYSIDGHTWTRRYDAATKTLTDTSPAGRVATISLDARGRVVDEGVAGQETHTYGYDARGRLESVATGLGPTLRTHGFVYGDDGLLVEHIDSLGRSTSFEHDETGRLTQLTSPDGPGTTRTIVAGYDASGNLTSLTPPGRSAHAFVHDPVDLKARYTPPSLPTGATPTSYTYDVDRKLTRVTGPGTVVDLGHDPAGRLDSVSLSSGVLGFGYDTASRLAGITAGGELDLAYAYDGDLLTSTAWSGLVAGSVDRTYDTSLRPASSSVDGQNAVNFGYDADDLLTSAGALSFTRHAQHGLVMGSTLGVVTDTWTYNGYAEPLIYSAAAGGTPALDVAYVRDAAGRITERTETIDGVTDVYTYAYDPAGRLTGVDVNDSTVETYTYDSNGNRLSASAGGSSRTATHDAQDRLATDGDTSFEYADSGHLAVKTTAAGDTIHAYDQFGGLVGVTLPDGTAITYLLDGEGNRVGKEVDGRLVQGFLYESSLRPIVELDAAGGVVSRFVYGTRDNVPEYMVRAGVTYRIITDHVGSPRLVVDTASGAVAQRMDYDAFGNVTADSNPGFQPFGFAGGLFDADTRLVRFGARDYDAETGRWTAKDPIAFAGGDANLYAYVGNDPVNFNDSDGLSGTAAWVKSRDTKLLKSPNYTSPVERNLQPGTQLKWLGRDPASGLSRVEMSLPGGGSCSGYVHPSNLTSKPPSSKPPRSDGKPVSNQAVHSSGVGTRG